MAAQTVLEMDFQTQLFKTHRMKVNEAKPDLTGEQVSTAMDNIIDKDVFSVTGGGLTGKIAARLLTTDVMELDLM